MTLNNNGNIIYCTVDNNNSASFKFKQKITGQIENGGTKVVSLKCLSNCWRAMEMSLIYCEISLQLKWSRNYIVAVTKIQVLK